MTLETLFLVLVPAYLVLVAYGQVGSRRRGLGAGARGLAGALRVLLPALVLLGALAAESDAALLRAWWPVVAGMAVAGALVAICVEIAAPRLGA